MADLVVTGGTVVTAERSFRADVAITGGQISAVGESLAAAHPEADTLDATGLLVLPGCVDVHTHTRLPTDDEPDRFFQDSVAAAFGGTTTFLAFNNPGTGISEEGAASLLAGMREFRARTAGESAVDFGLSAVITGQQADPVAELPELIAAGVPTAKAFMVYDFRLPDERLFAALRAMGRHGGMLQVHCENATVIDALVADALARGDVACRHHALTRPTYAEAEATHRAIALARAADASVYVVHLSCADALAEVLAAKARGWPVYAETCPHYLTLTDARYEAPDEGEVIRSVISPPAALRGGSRGAVAGTAGAAASTSWRPTTCRTGWRSRSGCRRRPSRRSATGRPGSRRCWRWSTTRAWPAAASPSSAWSTCWRRPPLASSGSDRRARSSAAGTPTSCSSTRMPVARSARPTCITPATSRRTRG